MSRKLEVGDEDTITVLNTASVGVYPDFVAVREQFEDRWGKWLAAVISAVRVLRRSEPVTVVVNGRRARVWTLFVGVGVNDPAPSRRSVAADSTADCSTCASCTRGHGSGRRPRSRSGAG